MNDELLFDYYKKMLPQYMQAGGYLQDQTGKYVPAGSMPNTQQPPMFGGGANGQNPFVVAPSTAPFSTMGLEQGMGAAPTAGAGAAAGGGGMFGALGGASGAMGLGGQVLGELPNIYSSATADYGDVREPAYNFQHMQTPNIQYEGPTQGESALKAGTGALKGAATGFMTGGPIGAGVGALIGGASGLIDLFKGKKMRDEFNREKQAVLEDVAYNNSMAQLMAQEQEKYDRQLYAQNQKLNRYIGAY